MSCPTCHGASKFQDRRDKTFVCLMGKIVLQGRAYYHCPACHAGHVPVDAALGFSASKLTPGAEEVATLAGTTDSFAEAAEKFLPKMSGLRLSESTVERTTEAPASGSAPSGTKGTPSAPRPTGAGTATRRGGPSPTSASTPRGSASRANAAPRPTAAWSGSARSSTRTPNPRGVPQAAPGRARYQAGLMGLEELGARLRRQAAQVGMDRAEQQVALTDGGNGLDAFMEVHFPLAVRILDFYHAAEHLGDLAKASYGDERMPPRTDRRVVPPDETRGRRRDPGDPGGAGPDGSIRRGAEAHRLVTGYVRTNLHRMDYPRYREEGWQIGSGHIEAACKTVVNQRLKQSGMRWGGDGADAVCHLRALYEGETSQWDAFWERSIN